MYTAYMLALKTCAVYYMQGMILGMGIKVRANTVPAFLEAHVRK